MTKDLDFFDELVLRGAPPKLLLVRCGTLKKRDLVGLFSTQLDAIVAGFTDSDLIELVPPVAPLATSLP